ncbi:hypothetical protein [Brevibacillus borstelensis]|uniref:hypothetical protein n=1 Tax=Brevibacillus borstelensis TaxID=45462 RepID=UPI0030C3BAB3
MNKLEKIIVLVFSFLFFPIGLIMWIVSMVSKNPDVKKIGRTALYAACLSFCIQIAIGIMNFIVS